MCSSRAKNWATFLLPFSPPTPPYSNFVPVPPRGPLPKKSTTRSAMITCTHDQTSIFMARNFSNINSSPFPLTPSSSSFWPPLMIPQKHLIVIYVLEIVNSRLCLFAFACELSKKGFLIRETKLRGAVQKIFYHFFIWQNACVFLCLGKESE